MKTLLSRLFGKGRRTRRDRGSLLILSVVVVMMIAFMGIAFIQQVKFDRFANQQYERDYMVFVINSILADLQTRLRDDVVDNFQAGRPLYDYPWSSRQQNALAFPDGASEPVQVAGSIEDDRYLASTVPVVTGAGTSSADVRWPQITNVGGIWLDLPRPDRDNPEDEPRETLIKQLSDQDQSNQNVSGEFLSESRDNNNKRFLPRGADADGDGVLDSRWTWAPVGGRDFGGKRYVMALRVVDLSSMINVNTATAATREGTDPMANPNWRPRGFTPLDVDLSRLLDRAARARNLSLNEWRQELDGALLTGRVWRRLLGQNASPFRLPAARRWQAWYEQASLYGDPQRNYTADPNELELRFRFGLNNDERSVALEQQKPVDVSLPVSLARLLRNDPVPNGEPGNPPRETSWSRVRTVGNQFVENMHVWFHGRPGPNEIPIRDREYPGIRHMLTTVSGAAVYAPSYISPQQLQFAANPPLLTLGGTPISSATTKHDLRFGNLGDLTALKQRIAQAFLYPLDDPGFWYLGLGNDLPELDELVTEYALAIKDYGDNDRVPTAEELDNVLYMGLEPLPFLREVYIQAGYVNEDLRNPDGNRYQSNEPKDTDRETWVYQDGSEAMVVELANPFDQDIETGTGTIDDSRPAIRVVIRNGSGVRTITLDPEIEIERRPENPGGNPEPLFVFVDADDPIEEDTDDGEVGDDVMADLGLDGSGGDPVNDFDGTEGFHDSSGGGEGLNFHSGDVVVELQVLATIKRPNQPDIQEWVTYDRLEHSGFSLPQNVETEFATPPRTEEMPQHAQLTLRRDGRSVRYLSNDGVNTGELREPGDTTVEYATADDNEDVLFLGESAKGIAGQSRLDTFQIPNASGADAGLPGDPNGFRSVAELAWVLMIGVKDDPADGRTRTLPERLDEYLADPDLERRLFLDTAPVVANVNMVQLANQIPPGAAVPHAAILMDLFTTVSPADDGEDNDGSGQNDNAGELKVAGTININTAPLHVLTLAAPLPEDIDSIERLMRAVVAYRDFSRDPVFNTLDGPRMRNVGSIEYRVRRNNPDTHIGLASLGELLFINPEVVSPFAPSAQPGDVQWYGYNGQSNSGSGFNAYTDVYPDPSDNDRSRVGFTSNPDPVLNREEALQRFQFLSQAFTVRSDTFAVHGVVRGYRAGQFNTDPAEEAQFIAIIDRSNLAFGTGGTSQAAQNPADNLSDRPRVIAFMRLK